ncbi:hypothetical protein MES4922_180028 [Mesorhizobium ventifaucium]|uniref:Tc1-like transposase DDE domain-containing protein n=1 Tax=Mesorhizobium ventifaucium TaxID=666020 RepID=A0ABN8JGU7_9HYPH|nr:hypothetical protein MES4922_180028 [Mesorhizobium ventifaucium]
MGAPLQCGRSRWPQGRLVERAGAAAVACAEGRIGRDRGDRAGPGYHRSGALAARRSPEGHQGALRRRLSRTLCVNASKGARLRPHECAAAAPGAGRRDRRGLQKNFTRTLSAHLAGLPKGRPVEIWFQDEARVGQKNGLVRQWARRGTRPRQPADQRYKSAYLFGAICPARGMGAALALPFADTEAMQLHLDEISRNVTKGAHAVLLLDRAGWHTTPELDVRQHDADLPTVPRTGTEPGRKCLAVSARQLALQPRLRHLRRHHRRRLRRLAKAPCRTNHHHFNRNAPMGSRRSILMTVGITARQ